MTNETNEPKQQPEPATPTITAADVRNHELFQKLTTEVKASKDALERFKADQAAAKEDAEKKALEAAGNWEALREKLGAEHAAALAAKEAELTNERLTNALLAKGVTHEFALMAARQMYQPGEKELGEFVDEFIASDQVQALVAAKGKDVIPPAPGGAAAGRAQTSNWAQVKAELYDRDITKVKAAQQAVEGFYLEHGRMPPGFE